MKIIETANYKNRMERHKGRNNRRDIFRTKHNLPGGKYKRVRGEPSIEEEKPNNPNYDIPAPPLDDPIAINEIRQTLIDYPGVDIEVLADGLRIPIEHVQQVAESIGWE